MKTEVLVGQVKRGHLFTQTLNIICKLGLFKWEKSRRLYLHKYLAEMEK